MSGEVIYLKVNMSGEESEVNKIRINKVDYAQKALTETINRNHFNVTKNKRIYEFSHNDWKTYFIKFNDSDYNCRCPWFDNTKESMDVSDRQKIRINFESTDLLSNNNKIFLEAIKNLSEKIKSSIEILPFTYYKMLKYTDSTKKGISSKDNCYFDFTLTRQYNNEQIPVYFESKNINNEYKIDRVLVDDDDHLEGIIRNSSKIKFDFLFRIKKYPFWWNNLLRERERNNRGNIHLIKNEDMWIHTNYHESIYVTAIYVKLKSPPFDEFFIKNFCKQKCTPLYNNLIDIEDENNLKESVDTPSAPLYNNLINIEDENNLNESVDTQSGAVQVFDVSTLPVADVYMIAEAHRINDD